MNCYYLAITVFILLIVIIICKVKDDKKRLYSLLLVFICLLIVYMLKQKNQENLDRIIYSEDTSILNLDCNIDPLQELQGQEYFKDKKVIITGLIRNSEDTIDKLKLNLKKIANIFHDYRVLIVENDSNDNTRKLLLQMAREDPKIIILGCGINVDKCSIKDSSNTDKGIGANRIKKMTKLRNIYLDYIKDNKNEFESYDFLICMDMDIIGTIYTAGLLHSGYLFKEDNTIDGLCANGIQIYNNILYISKLYYDSYALKMAKDPGKVSSIEVFPYPKCLNGSIKVKSCFGGFAIYRFESLKGKAHLFKMENKNDAICEHTTLNEQLDNIYINPYMFFMIIHNK